MKITKQYEIVLESSEECWQFSKILEVARKNIKGHEFRTPSGGYHGSETCNKIENLLGNLKTGIS